jgi:nucleotide-binding universal stress UspA family protein
LSRGGLEGSPNPRRRRTTNPGGVGQIAVGVDGYPEGRDAATLGAALARATGADLMLVTVHLDPLVPLPSGLDWSSLQEQSELMLRETRGALAPDARYVVETDFSVPRALERVVRREHRDLLVVGSSRDASDGHVRIGKRTRQLIGHAACALAIAPRGMHRAVEPRLARVGVGYDGGPESEAALSLARSIALAAGAELHIRGVVDDRVAPLAYAGLGRFGTYDLEGLARAEVKALSERTVAAAGAADAKAHVDVSRGRPVDRLSELCADVDLLVIGSRRWGAVARLLLGSTGEALLQGAASCPVLIVPRPQG